MEELCLELGNGGEQRVKVERSDKVFELGVLHENLDNLVIPELQLLIGKVELQVFFKICEHLVECFNFVEE